MFHGAVRSQRPYGKAAPFEMAHISWHYSYMYRTEWQDTSAQPLKVVQNPSNSFISTVKLSDLGRRERENVCVLFSCASEQIKRYNCGHLPHQSDYFRPWFGKLRRTYCAALARHVIGFKGAAHHLIWKHFTCTHTNHYSTLFSLDCIAHYGQEQSCAFFCSFFFSASSDQGMSVPKACTKLFESY